jgi:hypothetical protein
MEIVHHASSVYDLSATPHWLAMEMAQVGIGAWDYPYKVGDVLTVNVIKLKITKVITPQEFLDAYYKHFPSSEKITLLKGYNYYTLEIAHND